MKLALAVSAAVLCLFAVPRPAVAGCSAELAAGSQAPVLPLPSECRALGPIHLGMSAADLVAALGPPDQLVTSDAGLHGAIYAFPRHVGSRYQKGFKTIIYIHKDVAGEIQAVLQDGKVVSIHVSGNSGEAVPYSVGGIAIGQPLDELLRNVKTPPRWNATQNHAMFVPYPLDVQVDPRTRQILGITIATGTEL
ncbi:MAG: hypothetical protein ACREPZ_05515, partial [Rhodanobacteraceae bacterium]